MKNIIILFLIFFTLCTRDITSADQVFPIWHKEIDQEVREALKNYPIPGIVVLVGTKQKILFQKSYGYLSFKRKKKVSVSTLYDIASITKLFTAASIMILCDQEKLAIEDKVKTYLGENFPNSDITLENLLRHISGMRPEFGMDKLQLPSEEKWNAVCRVELDFPIGTFKYSDVNFLLLGKIVERVSKMDLNSFEHRYIFSLLGMKNTSYCPLKCLKNCNMRCAPTKPNICAGTVHDPTACCLGGITGHAGLFSNAIDLSKFCQFILNQGTYNNEQILQKKTILRMTSAHENHVRGLGFDILSPFSCKPRGKEFTEGESFGHTGFTGISLWIEPKKNLFLITLSNVVLAKDTKKAKSGLHPLWGKLADIVVRGTSKGHSIS